MNLGRPPIYTDEIVSKSEQYLSECIDEIEEYHKTRGDKSDTYERIVKVKLPTIEGLAVYLGISRETVYAWEKEEDKKSFSDILGKLRAVQANTLINNGLSGDYNPVIAKLLLMKHGYVEKQETDVTSKGESVAPVLVKFIDGKDNRDS